MRGVNQCLDCKYWSELIAKCNGDGPVQAMCLNRESRNFNKYTVDRVSCDHWAQALHGRRVDTPEEQP